MRLFAVTGTRPEVVKMARIIHIARGWGHEVVHHHTDQHSGPVIRELFEFFQLSSEHGRAVDQWSLPDLLRCIQARLADNRPDVVLVQGDTTSALAGALAGFNAAIPVVHVEAGLRTLDLDSPHPEEGYRQMIARIAALHLAPTKKDLTNLRVERVAGFCRLTGNPVISSLAWALRRPGSSEPFLGAAPYILVTMHRREGRERILPEVMEAARLLGQEGRVVHWVMHPSNRQEVLRALRWAPGVELHGPMPYPQFVQALRGASTVITDSGGLQEETAFLGVRAIVARKMTERESPYAEMAVRATDIVNIAERHLRSREVDGVLESSKIFGDGDSALRCVEEIEEFFRGYAR